MQRHSNLHVFPKDFTPRCDGLRWHTTSAFSKKMMMRLYATSTRLSWNIFSVPDLHTHPHNATYYMGPSWHMDSLPVDPVPATPGGPDRSVLWGVQGRLLWCSDVQVRTSRDPLRHNHGVGSILLRARASTLFCHGTGWWPLLGLWKRYSGTYDSQQLRGCFSIFGCTPVGITGH